MSEVLEKQYQKLKEIQENAGTTPMENENNKQQHRLGCRRRREPFSRGCKNANFGNSRAYFFAFFREL